MQANATMKKAFIGFWSLAFLLVFCSAGLVHAQETGEIRGSVKDALRGDALIGASITLVGTTIGATTNLEGIYVIRRVPVGEYTVQARFIGYTPVRQSVTVGANQVIELNFDMKEDLLKVEEVLVTGLSGEFNRAQLGATVSKIEGTEIAKVVSTNVLDAITGRTPGVQVTKSTGTPGTGSYVVIRGRTTITGSSQPLYVVDGMPIDNTWLYFGSGQQQSANRATDINPNDIESVEILKGATAAAVYGSRAANGVILIRTKSGRRSTGDKFANIFYSSAFTTSRVYGRVPLQTKYGQGTAFTATTGFYRPYAPGTTASFGPKLPDGTTVYEHDRDIFRAGNSVENTLSVTGGNPTFTYLVSGTMTNDGGTVINSQYNRYSLRLNLDYAALENLRFKSYSNYVNSTTNLPQDGSNTSGILLGALRTPPEFSNLVYYEDDGRTQRRFASYDNPIWTMYNNTYRSDVRRFIHNATVDWTPYDWIRLTGKLGLDKYDWFDARRIAVDGATAPGRAGAIDQDRLGRNNLNSSITATATRQFGDNFNATLILGQELSFFKLDRTIGTSQNTLPFFDEIGAGITKDASSSLTKSRIYGYFGQMLLSAWEKLSITASLRRDASSTFGEAKRFHYYPKASIAYRLSEESFMQGLKGKIDEVKLRAGWGITGNQPGTYAANYLYLTSGFGDPWGRSTSAGRSNQSGIRHSTSAGNSEIKPEKNNELELGFDLAFLNRRLSLEFSHYRQDVSDLLLFVNVPTSTGYSSQLRNAGKMENRGLELKLEGVPVQTSNFRWISTVIYAQNKNRVTKLEGFAPGAFVNITGAFAGIINVAMEGQPLGVFRGLGWLRDDKNQIVYSTGPSDDTFGFATNAPRYAPGLSIIGNPNPRWTGSFKNEIMIGKLSISALVDVVWGFTVWNGTKGALYNFGTHKDTEDRDEPWFNEKGQPVINGRTTTLTRYGRTYQPGEQLRREIYYRDYANGFNINEPHMEDGSFVKLRDVTISYRIGPLPFFRLDAITFTLSGRNLATYTRKYTGYDPEVNTFAQAEGRGYDYFTLPQVRSFRFGIALNY